MLLEDGFLHAGCGEEFLEKGTLTVACVGLCRAGYFRVEVMTTAVLEADVLTHVERLFVLDECANFWNLMVDEDHVWVG